MQLVIKVLLTFLRFLPADKLIFGKGVIAGITKTVSKFPNLPVTLVALQALSDALDAAITGALTGSDTAESALVTAIKNWNAGFKSTANYVNLIANGDKSIIVGAGFTASKEDSSSAVLPAVLLLFKLITSTIKGWFGASVKPFVGKGSKAYVFIAYPAEVTVTQSTGLLTITQAGISTYIKIGTEHLVYYENMPKTEFNVVAFGVNSVGMGPMTTPAPITPQ